MNTNGVCGLDELLIDGSGFTAPDGGQDYEVIRAEPAAVPVPAPEETAAPVQQSERNVTQVLPPQKEAVKDTHYARPSETGLLPLLDAFRPTVEDVIRHFGISYSTEDFWVHLNSRLLSGLFPQDLDELNPYSVIEYLTLCRDNDLNPLKPEVGAFYDWNTKCIKSQILLDGYARIYSRHPQTDGMEYVYHGETEVELFRTVYEYDPQSGQKKMKRVSYLCRIPRTVECRIFRKDRKFPTCGSADAEDIGNSPAWQQHPLQMLRNRAFTRAVRLAFNLEGASYGDVEDIHENREFELSLKRNALETRQEALTGRERRFTEEKRAETALKLETKIRTCRSAAELDGVRREITGRMSELGPEHVRNLLTLASGVSLQMNGGQQSSALAAKPQQEPSVMRQAAVTPAASQDRPVSEVHVSSVQEKPVPPVVTVKEILKASPLPAGLRLHSRPEGGCADRTDLSALAL